MVRNPPVNAVAAAAAAKSLQSCLTLCDPIDGSPPGSPVPGILQVRTLEWLASSFSSGQCSRRGFSLVWKILWRRKWQSSLVFLPGKSRVQTSLEGYSAWGHKKSDST